MARSRYHVCVEEQEKAKLDLPFVGIRSFGKYPVCSDLDKLDADVAIVGMPYEATQYRPGAKMGPEGLRNASMLYSFGLNGVYDQVNDEMILTPPTRIVDCGDVDMVHGDLVQCFENIEAMVSKIVAQGAVPIGLGGTMQCPYRSVMAWKKPGRLMWFKLTLTWIGVITARDKGSETEAPCAVWLKWIM